MNSEWFEKVIKEQIKTCEDVLIGKAKEYATDDDRLHNFKNAAGMMSCDPKEALAGMMAKHTISVYDMCRSGKDYPIELWNEKITDHINYLLLLKAIVEEDYWHETLGNEGEKYCNKMLVNEGENIVKKLKRMAENSIYGLAMTKDSEDTNEESYFTVAYGEVPTFNGKPVEIKEQDGSIDEVIKGLTICASDDGDCKDYPYNDGFCSDCTDNLKKDAAELLEKYKSISGKPASKGKEKTPKIKEDPEALDEAIKSFRRTLVCCGDAQCEACHHYNLLQIGEKCSTGLLDEFDNIVIRLKEAPHDNP